jgi:hypothetical protein
MEKNSKNDEQILIKKNKQIYELSREISNLEKLLKELPQSTQGSETKVLECESKISSTTRV